VSARAAARDSTTCSASRSSVRNAPDAASRTRRGRSAIAEKVVALKPAEAAETAEVDLEDIDVDLDVSDEDLVLEEEGDEDDEDLIEDASELGEDDEDMAEVIENVDEEDER